jgi:hypothetical protein
MEARLAVIPSLVREGHGSTCEDQLGVGKVQAAFGETRLALGFIPAVHGLMYLQKVKSQLCGAQKISHVPATPLFDAGLHPQHDVERCGVLLWRLYT